MVKVKIVNHTSEIKEPKTFYLIQNDDTYGTFDIYFTDDLGTSFKSLDKGTDLKNLTSEEETVLSNFINNNSQILKLKQDLTNLQLSLSATREYPVTWVNGVTDTDKGTNLGRRKLEVKNGIGKIHLDFSLTRNATIIGELPADAPTPNSLIETQLRDGATIWVRAGDRSIRIGSNPQLNSRYIIDLIGFFS